MVRPVLVAELSNHAKQRGNFVVGGLREVAIPLPDCREVCGRARADHLVRKCTKRAARVRSADGYGDDDARWPLLLHRLNGGLHRRSRRQAVVDVYVGYLRKKLEHVGSDRLIRTVRGVGFMLEPE